MKNSTKYKRIEYKYRINGKLVTIRRSDKIYRQYKSYRNQYQKLKKSNNLADDERQYSLRQFYKEIKKGNTAKDIIEDQRKYDPKLLKKAIKDYKNLGIKPGEVLEVKDTYRILFENIDAYAKRHGTKIDSQTLDQKYGYQIRYHRTESGILSDRNLIHLLIVQRLRNGEDHDKVLEDYGY